MKIESQYDIGDLVEYKQDRNDESNKFGHIVDIIVYKPTAGYSMRFNIIPVNAPEGSIDREIYDSNVIKKYGVVK